MTKYKITKNLIKNWKWLQCWYVWKIWESEKIVLYEWTIKEDLWDKVKCIMVDQNINTSYTPFEIILDKNKINIIK